MAPSGDFLYVSDDNSPSLISAYSINQNTGALTPIAGSPFPAGPTPFYRLSYTADGRFLLVPNLGGGAGSGSVFAINQQTGALTNITGSPFPAGTETSAVAIDSQGKFAYACGAKWRRRCIMVSKSIHKLGHSLQSRVLHFRQHAQTCLPIHSVRSCTHRRTRHSWSTSAITAFTINQNTGVLSPIAGSPFSGSQGDGLVVDPSGHFLYGANPNA